MNYNMSNNIQSEANEVSFMDVGIHDNVELKNVRYEISKNGNPFLAFDFDNDKGKSLSHTEWKPADNADESKVTNQMKRIRHIVVKFIPEDKYIFQANSFEDFAEKTVALLGNAYVGKKVRIKVVYNNKDWTDLPNYLPFIEPMDIPKNESKLEMISIDKVKKSETPDNNSAPSNPFDSNAGNSPINNAENSQDDSTEESPF